MFRYFLCAFFFYSVNLYSEEFKIVGNLHLTPSPSQIQAEALKEENRQTITLMKLFLPQSIKRKFPRNNQFSNLSAREQIKEASLPVAIDLGMENAPVLNQGVHGTCVVFAISAAIDAIIKKGDYASPLCSLQLGQYFQVYGYSSSGWDGGLGMNILSQFERFGFLNKEKQFSLGCGGLFDYPLLQQEHGEAMPPELFYEHSESLSKHHIGWSNLVDIYQSLYDDIQADQVLLMVKKALSSGDRLVLGILLADYEKGLAGAVGTYKAYNDTWLITPEILEDIRLNPQFAGHELLLIGYDDLAVAKDEHGRSYRGLLKVRNSWGDKIGDHGDFYISYDYFKALVIELQRIRKLPKR
jgi:hypothetical protein